MSTKEQNFYSRREVGKLAENAVAEYLASRRIKILRRNLRLGYLELDIVAQDRDVLIIVEVRARGPGALQSALQSISLEKRRRIRRAGYRLWQKHFRSNQAIHHIRYDVAALSASKNKTWTLEYIEAAF